MLLPENGVAWACDAGTPSTGALFASVEDTGRFLVHDRRLTLLVENSIESPAGSGAFAADEGKCATVPRTFLNARTCVVGAETCAARRHTSAEFLLNETMIREFFVRGGRFVHVIQGFRLEVDAPSPCSGMSRWMHRSNNVSECAGTVNAQTQTAFQQAFDATRCGGMFLGNGMIRDVEVYRQMRVGICSADAGVAVEIGDSCWQHVHLHPYEGNVYDLSTWTLEHDGNTAARRRGKPNSIAKWARIDSAVLQCPVHHPASRFELAEREQRNEIHLLGWLGDTVDFLGLPSSVKSIRWRIWWVQTQPPRAVAGSLAGHPARSPMIPRSATSSAITSARSNALMTSTSTAPATTVSPAASPGTWCGPKSR